MRPASRRLQLDAPLVWTSTALACAVALHVGHQPFWVFASFALLVGWRASIGLRGARLPSGWLRVLAIAAVLLGVLFTFRTLNGLNAGTAMLTLMAGIKLLETRTPRDHVVLLLITYFLILAAFLHSQHLLLAPLYALIVLLTTTALLRVTQQPGTQTPRESARLAGRMLLQALPLMIVLFMLFPRVPGPFWALPETGRSITGLSDTMSPGDITELSLQSTVAFRVRFDGAAPPAPQRYWRGPVLHDFDGYTWRRERAITHASATPKFAGPAYTYTLMLEPSGQSWVFALDLPEQVRGRRLSQGFDYQVFSRDPIDQPTTITLTSRPGYRFEEPLGVSMRRRDTRLDPDANPRTRTFAASLRSRAASEAEYVASVLAMFREQEFFYTLSPPGLNRNSVDEFLFETRSGFCGHYASAFTMMMRAVGIPSRVVTGYQGGELNRYAGYYIVRQSDAHAWSEVWLEGRGWVRVDPTAAVAPERIEEAGLFGALAANEPIADRFLRGTPLLAEIRFAWDAIDTRWREYVLDFSANSQRLMLEWLGFEAPDWRELTALLAAGLIVFTLICALQLRRAMQGRQHDPVLRLYQRFCRKIERRGLRRAAHEGPLDFARRIARERPDLAEFTGPITDLYLELRYGTAAASEALERLRRSVNGFP